MAHSVLKTVLKAPRLLTAFLTLLALLLCIKTPATALTPGGIRITQPQNGFYINRYNVDAYPISGQADAGRDVAIFANGILMGTAAAGADGFFSISLDFSNHIEGAVTILAFQKDVRSIPVTGTYDATPPKIVAAAVDDRSIAVTFNESSLLHVEQERNYRFSPSLNFKTPGGVDDIARIDEFSFRLSMRSIPPHEIIRLSLSEITDAAGNVVAAWPVALNDRDEDRMADLWEVQHGLNPLAADALSDNDGDGFLNYQEYLARSNPALLHSAPIEIRDTLPQDDAGIVNYARVPDQTSVAVLIHAAHGIDIGAPGAIRFRVDDGDHQPYWRDLHSDAVRIVKLDQSSDSQATYLWAAYDRLMESVMPTAYPTGAVVQVAVVIEDIGGNILQPAPFEFRIESPTRQAASGQNLPDTVEFYADETLFSDGIDTGIEIAGGGPVGARVLYSSLEPLTPQFGPSHELEAISRANMRAAGVPVNLLPHTVFDTPVRLFIPVRDDVDIRSAGLAYYDGTQWLPAVDARGNLLPGGQGWMVPGSRINHEETSPALIEVQVYHFSGAQAVVFVDFDDTTEKEKQSDSSNASVFITASCFIDAVGGGPSAGSVGWIALIGMVAFLLHCKLRCQRTRLRSGELRRGKQRTRLRTGELRRGKQMTRLRSGELRRGKQMTRLRSGELRRGKQRTEG